MEITSLATRPRPAPPTRTTTGRLTSATTSYTASQLAGIKVEIKLETTGSSMPSCLSFSATNAAGSRNGPRFLPAVRPVSSTLTWYSHNFTDPTQTLQS